MTTLELTEEEIGTLIEALGDWLNQPGADDTREWLRRQDAGADLDMDLREAFNRRNDGWDAACAAAAEILSKQTPTPASRLKKHPAPQLGARSRSPAIWARAPRSHFLTIPRSGSIK